MPIWSKKEGGDFQLVSAGTHEAVCCAVWDLKRQAQVWNNQEKIMKKVIIAWEIAETIKDVKSKNHGKRLVISKKYTNSLGDKTNLRKDLESWRGRAFTKEELNKFDLERLIGINCLLSIVHNAKNDKIYSNISAVMKAMKGKEKMVPENLKDFCPGWVKDLQAKAVPEKPKEPEDESQELDIDMSQMENGEIVDDDPFGANE